MFPLFQKELPTNADELTMALETSLRRLLLSSQKVVSIRARDYPKVDEIVINLNDAEIHHRPARLSPATGETTPFMTVNRLSLTGRQISFGLASLGLNITAQDVVFHQGRDDNGDVILLPYRIANGQVAISISQDDLEAMVGQLVKIETARRGFILDDLHLNVELIEPKLLQLGLLFSARKLFVRATIRIRGKLAIEDQLIARIFDLTCAGEGAMARLACSILDPHLQTLDGQEFELMPLPLGEIQVHSLRIAVNKTIEANAEFRTKPS